MQRYTPQPAVSSTYIAAYHPPRLLACTLRTPLPAGATLSDMPSSPTPSARPILSPHAHGSFLPHLLIAATSSGTVMAAAVGSTTTIPVVDANGGVCEEPRPRSAAAVTVAAAGGKAAASRGIPQAMVVVAQVEVPHNNPPSGTLVSELLMQLLPQHCPSITAAKRTLRRRLVVRVPAASVTSSPCITHAFTAPLPGTTAATAHITHDSIVTSSASSGKRDGGDEDGSVSEPPHPCGIVASTFDTASPGDILQLLARNGTGRMGPWVVGEKSYTGNVGDSAQGAGGDGGGSGADGVASQITSDGTTSFGSVAVGVAVARPGLPGLPVVYEDDHVAVVVKPPGIPTQGSGTSSVQGRLKYCLRPSPLVGALNRPQQVHRLDGPTGGLLLVAKTHVALRLLAVELQQHRVTKRYCALVKGIRSGSGVIDMPLSGKPCITYFAAPPSPPPTTTDACAAQTQAPTLTMIPSTPPTPAPAAATNVTAPAVPSFRHGALTKVLLWPRTGRTHQLRKHMAYTGTPMLGDARYRGGRAPGPMPARKRSTPTEGGDNEGSDRSSGGNSNSTAHCRQEHQEPQQQQQAVTIRGLKCGEGVEDGASEEGCASEDEMDTCEGPPRGVPDLLCAAQGTLLQLDATAAAANVATTTAVTTTAATAAAGVASTRRGWDIVSAADDCASASAYLSGGCGRAHPGQEDSRDMPVGACSVSFPGGDGAHDAHLKQQMEGWSWTQGLDGDSTGSANGEGGAEPVVQLCRPPAHVQWVMTSAAAAAATEADSGSGGGDVLSDGSPVSLCLWAIGLRFKHPVSGQVLDVDIREWVDVLYDDVLRREAAAAAATAATVATTVAADDGLIT